MSKVYWEPRGEDHKLWRLMYKGDVRPTCLLTLGQYDTDQDKPNPPWYIHVAGRLAFLFDTMKSYPQLEEAKRVTESGVKGWCAAMYYLDW